MADLSRKQIKWRLKGFEEIRRSPGVEARLRQEVSRVMAGTGATGYDGGVEDGKTRSRGYVVTTTRDAIVDNAQNHTLLRALGGSDYVVYTNKAGKTRLTTEKQAKNWGGDYR